jgi:hypothetical protein
VVQLRLQQKAGVFDIMPTGSLLNFGEWAAFISQRRAKLHALGDPVAQMLLFSG